MENENKSQEATISSYIYHLSETFSEYSVVCKAVFYPDVWLMEGKIAFIIWLISKSARCYT